MARRAEVRSCCAADRLLGRRRRDRRFPSTSASPREATHSHRAGVVDCARRRGLPGDARRFVSRRRDLRGGDRRRPTVRYAATADVFPWTRPSGEFDRRYNPTERSYPRRQPAARRALIEAAWTYRYPARVSDTLRARLEGLPGAEHVGGEPPVASYVAGLAPDARPLDRGKPRDEVTEGGNQPADKSLINRRLSLRSQVCAAPAFSRRRPFCQADARSAPSRLNANIRDYACPQLKIGDSRIVECVIHGESSFFGGFRCDGMLCATTNFRGLKVCYRGVPGALGATAMWAIACSSRLCVAHQFRAIDTDALPML
jgi:hypothetical protein